MTAPPAEFRATGPLPGPGITLLEASAGTGKTHTIATLVLRYVADGVPLRDLLVVTFTRMATGELRDRARARLVQADVALTACRRGLSYTGPDPVLRMLTSGTPAEIDLRWRRVRDALSDFDAATIATTHGFCQQVLDGLGVAGDTARDVVFAEDLTDLMEEVVDDLYVRRFRRNGRPLLSHTEARALGRVAIANPLAPVEPEAAPYDSDPAMRRRLVLAVREEFERRKRRMGLQTYDDQLLRLHETLAGPSGEVCRARLARRYRIAMIDEFQDTDPVQWDIAQAGFGTGTLVLIGDPKQAIYAFRGADVHTYLEAARTATARQTLGVSWRSDQPLLSALDALFDGASLGEDEIRYRPIRAAEGREACALTGAPSGAPLRVRVVDRTLVGLTPQRYARKDPAVSHIAADLAADVARLLASGARIPTQSGPGETEALDAGHVGVLVPTNAQAARVRDALVAAGVPAVISGGGSVFGSPAAEDWRRLLEGLERPSDHARAAAAALSCFVGWSADTLASCDEDEREGLHMRLHRWRAVLDAKGMAALTEAVMRGEAVAARLLARDGGERRLTDLRHVAQLLHQQETDARLGVSALVDWLTERIAQARGDVGEDRSRRLESDAQAVQVLTIHRAKGLEFPVVYLPYLWDGHDWFDQEPIPVQHDPAHGGERTIDVGGEEGPGFAARRARWIEEERGEDLRLAYVALTRARHQTVVWWAGSWDSRNSSLGRLLVDRLPGGAIPHEGERVPDDAEMLAILTARAQRCPGYISVETTRVLGPIASTSVPPPATAPVVAAFDRSVDTAWGRHSYSRLTEAARARRVASEPEHPVRRDEAAPPAEAPDVPAVAPPLPLGALPAGAAFGTLVHEVLEAVDFADPHVELALRAEAAPRLARGGVPRQQLEALVGGLAAAIRTPLGAALGGRALADIPAGDRLDELVFEFPLVSAGAGPAVTVDDVARLLETHLPADDPLAAYPARLRAASLDVELRGFMVGAVDVVARLGHGEDTRFVVLDHKTNHLGWPDEPSREHYRPDALAREMQDSHYVLQALIYLVAVHRYLRWRLPGYAPERHLGGAHYLFLRGLTGPVAEPADRPDGVFSWCPPPALILAASDLFDGARVTA